MSRSFVFFRESWGRRKELLPTPLGLGRLPFAASRRRRPRHDNALSDRDLFDVGQRERVALAETLGHGRVQNSAHRVCDLQQVARPATRRYDDLERIPVLLDQAQLREARFELFDRALGRAATPASPRLRFLSGSSGPSSGHQSVISEQPTLQSDPS